MFNNSQPNIRFEKIKIKTEKSSYLTTSNNINVFLGMLTDNLNIIRNTVNVEWKLIDKLGEIKASGQIDVKLGNYNTLLNISPLSPNNVYKLQLSYMDYERYEAIIYTGNMSNLNLIDENFIFPAGKILIYGDLILNVDKDGNRKIKFPYDWNVTRTVGNGIISQNNNYYVFSPKQIFTSRVLGNNILNFSPFDKYSQQQVIIRTIPKIKHIAPYKYSVIPKTKIKIKFSNQRIVYNRDISKYENIITDLDTYVTPGKVSTLDLYGIKPENSNVFNFSYIYE